jgi:hypothetical protein
MAQCFNSLSTRKTLPFTKYTFLSAYDDDDDAGIVALPHLLLATLT